MAKDSKEYEAIKEQMMYDEMLDEDEFVIVQAAIAFPTPLAEFLFRFPRPELEQEELENLYYVFGRMLIEGTQDRIKNPLIWNLKK